MLTRLTEADKNARIVGARQVLRALATGPVAVVYLAGDADLFVTRPVRELCREKNIAVLDAPSMLALGQACGIQVGTAAAAIRK